MQRPPIPDDHPQRAVYAALREFLDSHQYGYEAAAALGVSPGHLSSMANCRRQIPDRICALLGFRQRWERVK